MYSNNVFAPATRRSELLFDFFSWRRSWSGSRLRWRQATPWQLGRSCPRGIEFEVLIERLGGAGDGDHFAVLAEGGLAEEVDSLLVVGLGAVGIGGDGLVKCGVGLVYLALVGKDCALFKVALAGQGWDRAERPCRTRPCQTGSCPASAGPGRDCCGSRQEPWKLERRERWLWCRQSQPRDTFCRPGRRRPGKHR